MVSGGDRSSAGRHSPRNGIARTGIGYDSHRFASGGRMMLGGVEVASDMHLEGHSDGDAVAHALTDALLGAAAAGDIGEMFPDTDPRNKARDSMEMLRAAVDKVSTLGFIVVNVDVTVIAEKPRIGMHRKSMCSLIAAALRIDEGSVSVKGKTNEGLGWIGRGEGLACVAVATISAANEKGM